MKNYLKMICCLLLGSPFLVHAQPLTNYLKVAAENNPGVKSTYTEFEAALQRVAQVNALPDPTLSFGYFISPVETRVGPQRAKISLGQMFPWFGTLQAKEDMASLRAEARYQEFINARNQLYRNVKSAYYPLYETQEHIQKQQENLAILRTYKNLALTSFANARGTMVDVIRIDIMLENTETDIHLLEDRLKPLTVGFNNLLNRPDATPIQMTDSLELVAVQQGYRKDSLLVQNPLLLAIDHRIQTASALERVAQKNGLPQFGVALDYVLVDKRTDMDVTDNGKNVFMPMASMSLPIFRGKYKAQVKEAQLIQKALVFKKESITNSLESAFEMTWYQLEKARQLDALYAKQIVKTQQTIDLLYTAYSNSGKDFEELLRLQQQLLKYETARATSRKEFYTALAELDYLTAKSE